MELIFLEGTVTGKLKPATSYCEGGYIGADFTSNNYAFEMVAGVGGASYFDFATPGSDYRGRIIYWHNRDEMEIHTGGAFRAIFNNQGNLGLAGSLNESSDARLKDDVQEVDPADAIAMVKAVKPKTYVRNDMDTGDPRLGFIAQDLKSCCPRKVEEYSWLLQALRRDGRQGG